MVSICDGGSSKFIYNQNSEPYASMPFGLATVGHGGCGPVSVYNAMQILGRYDVEFEDVLEYYDENGGEVLFGWLGSLPHTAIQYFLDQGYKVAVLKGNEVSYGGGMSECFDASIVWYWFETDDFLNAGAHFFAIDQYKNGTYLYNYNSTTRYSAGSFYSFIDNVDGFYFMMFLIRK